MIAGSPIGACYVNEKRFLSLVQQWNMIRWHEKSHRLSLERTASEMVQRICFSLFWDSVRIAAKHTMPGDIPWQAYFLCGRCIRQTLLYLIISVKMERWDVDEVGRRKNAVLLGKSEKWTIHPLSWRGMGRSRAWWPETIGNADIGVFSGGIVLGMCFK